MEMTVIVAAAGSGSRMGVGKNKTLLTLAGRPVLQWSLALFQDSAPVREIIVAAAETDMAEIRHICLPFSKVRTIIGGGVSRAASVAAALSRVNPDMDRVAVHDAARPLLHPEDWQALLEAAALHDAVLLAAPLVDSIKAVEQGAVVRTIPREQVMAAQTPQIFAYPLLLEAYRSGVRNGQNATDDAELVERQGAPVQVVTARHPNFKLTYQNDLLLAELLLRKRLVGQA